MDMNTKLREAREQRLEKSSRMQDLLQASEKENRALNKDEQAEFDQLETECGELENRTRNIERQLNIGDFREEGNRPIGMNQQEQKRYSFLRALRAQASPNDRRAQDAAAFERECSQEVAKQRGQEARGIYVPMDVFGSASERRDLNVTTGTAGGNVVDTVLMAGSFIELLRNRAIVMGLGATVMDGLVGDVAVPKQTGGATAYWINSEGGAPTESQQTIGQVSMTPRTIGAFTDYTRNLLLQSSIGVENFVRGDLAQVLAIGIDLASIHGTGSSGQPTGIANTSGINTVSFSTSGSPTWAEMVEFETEAELDNAPMNAVSFLMEPTLKGTLKTTKKDAGSGIFLMEGNEVNGYPVAVTNQVTDDTAFFGDWSQLMVGMWGGLDLLVDPYTASTTGTVRVVALQSMDVAVRHAVAFVYGS